MSSNNDELPVRLTGQPAKKMPSYATLESYGNVLRSIAELKGAIAGLPVGIQLMARLREQLGRLNGLVDEFEEEYGRWTLPGAPASAPTMPAVPPRAAPPVPIGSKPMPSPTSMPHTPPIGTPPQTARGGLNKSTFPFLQVTADTSLTRRTDPASIQQVTAEANVTGATKIPQVSAASVKVVVQWKTLVNNDEPRADVQQTQGPFAAICELVKTCPPDRRAYYQSIRPATFMDFRKVQGSDNLQYKHDNGKVGPYRYGATADAELWLCFATFHTFEVCPHGAGCRYRHLTLTVHEIIWISRTVQGRKYVEGTFFKAWNAKGGKQPMHQARALPVPVSRPVPQPAAVGLSGANAATNAPRPMAPPRPAITARSAWMQQDSADEHAHAAATGEQTDATRAKRKADDADWSWSKRQRK